MSYVRRIANIVEYEWRRALAKKKFFALVGLALFLQVGTLLLFRSLSIDLSSEVQAMMWLQGVLSPQNLFLPLIAIIIAGGAMAEEYERGRADFLLSKPITKRAYMTGKYLGGLSLLILVTGLMVTLPIPLAWWFFGPQESLQFAPAIYLSMIYANLLVFSLAFMFSEVLRGTTPAIMAAIGIYIGSFIVSGYLGIVHGMTGEQFYQTLQHWLPSWSVANLPSFIASELLTTQAAAGPFVQVASGDTQLAFAVIAVYTVAAIVLALFRLIKSDVTNKAA